MKTIAIAFILLGVSGCADMGQRLQNAAMLTAQQQAYAAQYRANQPAYKPVPASPQTDQQCFSGCMQAGYQYGLCQSKCSY